MRLRSGVEVRSTLSPEAGQANMDSDTQSTDAQRGEDSQGGSFSASDLQQPLSPRSDKTVSPTRLATRRQHAPVVVQQAARSELEEYRNPSPYVPSMNRPILPDLTSSRRPQALNQSQNLRLYQTPQHHNRSLASGSSHDSTFPIQRFKSEAAPWSAVSPGANPENQKRKFSEVGLDESSTDRPYRDKLGTELDNMEQEQTGGSKEVGEGSSSRDPKKMRLDERESSRDGNRRDDGRSGRRGHGGSSDGSSYCC
ncbi:hypothetical protein B0J14DRAFT_356153 [Halenospora varia]|nr:hypothetical protein B0J14DRAFT_356153 [Halenospora varia]